MQDIGGHIATPRQASTITKLNRTMFDPDGVLTRELEAWIDTYNDALPPLTQFILPVIPDVIFFSPI